MAGPPLLFVLALLRKIKLSPEFEAGHSAQSMLQKWASGSDQEAPLRLLIAIQQNLFEAQQAIVRSSLTDEAKAGLLSTTAALLGGFSLQQSNNQLKGFLPSLDSAITNFAILTSGHGFEVPDDFFKERDSLVSEFEAFLQDIEAFEIDDRLKDVVKRQVSLLIALLNNAEAVGVEAALATYFELIIKFRNRATSTDPSERKQNEKLWDRICSWSDRIEALSKLYDFGQKLLPHLEKLPQISGLL